MSKRSPTKNPGSHLSNQIFRVFLSSTFCDLESERAAAVRALCELTYPLSLFGIVLIPIDLRRGASATPPLEECLAEVGRADLFVLLLGKSYGTEATSGKSFTECEYEEASRLRIDRLAFIARDDEFSLLKEESDPAKVDKLNRFRQKVLSDLKCDFFKNHDELRGHIMRDVLAWVFEQVPVSLFGIRPHIEKRFKDLKEYFCLIHSGDTPKIVDLVTSNGFAKDMRRFGIESVQKAVLQDLLELGMLSEPTKVTDPYQRSRLLVEYIDRFPDSISTFAAVAEAEVLEDLIDHPMYSFSLARTKAIATYSKGQYESSIVHLKNVLRYARATRDLHILGRACCIVGDFYAHKQDFVRSLRWQWRSIRKLISLVDICPFCLSRAFHQAGRSHASLGECHLATDRYGKALAIARMIPDRSMQAVILASLAQHYERHDLIRESVAAYVCAAIFQRESDPASEAADVEFLMGDLVIRQGRERIREVLASIKQNANQVVFESLKPYELDEFTDNLNLKPSPEGDHW